MSRISDHQITSNRPARGRALQRWVYAAIACALVAGVLYARAFDSAHAGPPPSTAADFNLYPSTRSTISPVLALAAGAVSNCPNGTNQSPCGRHVVYVPAANNPQLRPEQLFVFLPGTQSEPDKYEYILQMAAYAGYKTIGLSYDNTVNIEAACANNCGCYTQARRELIFGDPVSAAVSPAIGDTVVSRLFGLLNHLVLVDPAGNWGVFLSDDLDGIIEASDIDWPRIAAAGHSQGGGHSLMLSRAVQVQGVLPIDGSDDTCGAGAFASWHSQPEPPPLAHRRAFFHDRNGAFAVPDSFIAMGFGRSAQDFGVIELAWPSLHSVMTTNQPVPGGCTAHGSMAYDRCMPDQAGNVAATAPDSYLFEPYVAAMCEISGGC